MACWAGVWPRGRPPEAPGRLSPLASSCFLCSPLRALADPSGPQWAPLGVCTGVSAGVSAGRLARGGLSLSRLCFCSLSLDSLFHLLQLSLCWPGHPGRGQPGRLPGQTPGLLMGGCWGAPGAGVGGASSHRLVFLHCFGGRNSARFFVGPLGTSFAHFGVWGRCPCSKWDCRGETGETRRPRRVFTPFYRAKLCPIFRHDAFVTLSPFHWVFWSLLRSVSLDCRVLTGVGWTLTGLRPLVVKTWVAGVFFRHRVRSSMSRRTLSALQLAPVAVSALALIVSSRRPGPAQRPASGSKSRGRQPPGSPPAAIVLGVARARLCIC